MSYLEIFESHLHNPKRRGEEIDAQCPFHKDRQASFSANMETGLWKCHAGCGDGNARQFAERLGVEAPTENDSGTKRQVITRYEYKDEYGHPLFRVCRTTPKGFFQERYDSGQWVSGIKEVRRVLYRLPEVLKAQVVYIVEGEKDVDRLWSMGIPTTCNPGGAGKWRDEYSAIIAEKKAIIIPDNDNPGEDHVLQVAKSLLSFAEVVKVVSLPGLGLRKEKHGEDISDWLDAGHSREELARIVKETPRVTRESLGTFLPTPPLYTPGESEEVKTPLIWAKDVPPLKEGEELESLWGPFLFPSSLHTMWGDAGLGKTTLLYNIAIRMARGEEFGGFKPPRPLRVLYYDLETPDLLFRRKLHLISENDPPKGLAFARSFYASEALALAKEHGFDLIIIDTLNEAFETKDEGDNAEANREMRELRRIVKDSGAAIVALSHMGKDPSAKGVYKLRGASARPAAADVVLNVETYSDDVICLEVAKNRWVGGNVKLYLRKAGEDQFEVAEVAGENTATAEKQIREYIASIVPYEPATIKTQEILSKAVESGFQRSTTEKVLSRMSQVGGGGVKRKKRGVYTRTKAGVEAPDPSFRLPGGIGKSDSEEVQKEKNDQCQPFDL